MKRISNFNRWFSQECQHALSEEENPEALLLLPELFHEWVCVLIYFACPQILAVRINDEITDANSLRSDGRGEELVSKISKDDLKLYIQDMSCYSSLCPLCKILKLRSEKKST